MPRICRSLPNARLARLNFSFPVALAFLLAILAAGNRAAAQTCTSSPCSGGAISTNPTSDPSKENQSASSSIVVSLGGTVNSAAGSVAVELDGLNTNTGSGLTNDSLGEASFVLTGPGGAMVLLGSTGNGSTLTGYQITVSDSAGSLAPYDSAFGSSPTTVRPGSYWVANYNSEPNNLPGGTVYPTTDGIATLSSVFGGFSTDGTWKLYAILSNNDNSAVSISGWKLYLTYTATTNDNTATVVGANNNHQSLGSNVTFMAMVKDTTNSGTTVNAGTVTFTDVTSNSTLCTSQSVSNGTATCTVSASTLGEGFSTIEGAYSGTGFVASNGTMTEMVEGTSTSSNGGLRWCNSGPVTSNGGSSTGKVYPSIITVSGLSNTVANVEVELNGVTTTSGGLEGAHLLVAPGGTKNLDFLDEGFSVNALSDVNVDILDSASIYPNGSQTPTNNSRWNPTDNNQLDTGFTNTTPTANSLDSAVPDVPGAINYAHPLGSVNESFETNFNGASANGDWALYLIDTASVTVTLSGGWCLDFTLNTGTSTTTTVSSSNNQAGPNGAHVGDNVTLTATVKDSSNSPVSSGTVTFTENGVAPAGTVSGNNVVTPNGSGQATFTTSALAEGDHTIIVNYSGDSEDNESQGTIVQRIDNKTVFTNASGVIQACNPGAITSTEGATGAFTPNPSNLFVQNLPGTVQSVTLTLNNMYAMSDLTINNTAAMVAGPNNEGLDFYSGTGDGAFGPFGPFNMVFFDLAGEPVPQSSYAGGGYTATDYDASDTFFASASTFYPLPGTIASAPAHGSATFGSVFADGMNGNGTWSLFWDVTDKALAEGTQNGWCLNFTENPVAVTATLPDASTFQAEAAASFTVDIANSGPGSTGDPTGGSNPMTMTDTLPNGLNYTGFSGTGWSCPTPSNQTVTCTNDSSVAEGSEYPELTIDVDVYTNATSLSNSVTVSGAGAASTSSNTDQITITPAPALELSKSSPGNFTQGGTGTWNLTLSNLASAGPTYTTITVTDPLPNGYTLASYSSSAGNVCGSAGNEVTCTLTNVLQPGGSVTFTLHVNVPANSPTSVTNTATWSGGGAGPTGATTGSSNSNTVTVVQVPASVAVQSGNNQSAPDQTAFASPLAVLVTDAGGVGVPGATVTFTAPAPTGPSVTFAGEMNTATTNSSGVATSVAIAANRFVGGPYTVTASVSPGAGSTNFQLTNTIGIYSQLAVSAPSTFYAGVPAQFTVTAEDAGGNAVSAINDTLHFTSSDTAATLPPDTPLFNGMGTFTATLNSAGSQTISATDSTVSITGVSGGITVSPVPLLVVTTNADDAGSAGNCTPQASSTAGTDAACSLRDALLEAASLGAASISFDSSKISGANSTITLSNGVLTIPTYTAITGTYTGSGSTLSHVVTVSGNGQSGVFQVSNANAVVSITGLAIGNGLLSDPTNGGTEEGAGLYNNAQNGTLTIAHSTFSNNAVSSLATSGTAAGGAIFNNGQLTLNDCVFNGNSATAGGNVYGGAIYDAYQMQATNIIVTDNTATNSTSTGIASAGGILAGADTITGSTFSGNQVIGPADGTGAAYGGALFVTGPTTLTYSTISGNTAQAAGGGQGGGIYLVSRLTSMNTTITNNTADNGGGAILNQSTLKLKNNILAGNSAPSGGGILNDGSITASYNLLSGDTGGECAGGSGCPSNGSNGNIIGGTASLAALGSYGGPTQTMLPLPGSTAICAGSASVIPSGVTTDQRGLPNTNTTYPGYSAGNPCVDVGAVQTNYALSFSQQPSNVNANAAISPAPAVSVSESGNPINGASVSISAAAGTLSGTSTQTTVAGIATFSGLSISQAESNDTLTASLNLPSISIVSNSFNVSDVAPSLTSPSASPLGGPTQFTWNPGAGASMFALWIGTAQGSYNLYTTGHVANTVTSATFNVPANGATLHVRLWYELNGNWEYKDYTFTEDVAPALSSPSSSPVGGPTQFTWNPGTGSTMYALWIGTTPGTHDIYTTGHVANTVTSETVYIPANGATLYVRLWYELNGEWEYTDYTFTDDVAPALTSPTSSPLGGPTQFTWSPGTGASMYALWIGTARGIYNLYTTGHVANTVTSATFNVPVNGATIYVRLWYELNGDWEYTDYTFTEKQAPSLTGPTASPLSGSTQFTWSPGNVGASMFALWIGTSPGTNNLYTSGHVANTVTSETVNIPSNGAMLYVRLWYELNGDWEYKDYTFTEAP